MIPRRLERSSACPPVVIILSHLTKDPSCSARRDRALCVSQTAPILPRIIIPLFFAVDWKGRVAVLWEDDCCAAVPGCGITRE